MNYAARMMISSYLTLSILCVLSVSAPARAQRSLGAYEDILKLPDGVIGERVSELLETINANDPAKVRNLIETRFTSEFKKYAPMDEHLAVFSQVYNQNRGLKFYAIRIYKEKRPASEVVVIVRSKLTQAWKGMIMMIEQNPPHRVAGLQFAPARPPSDLLQDNRKLTDAEMVKELETFVKRMADAEAFSGTVLLAKNGEVLFKGAYGLASKRFNVPNKIDTKFNLGSMNKMFTGVAIAQLAQRSKLSLNDSLSQYLSTEWLPRDITSKIKIKHLLTHTSGLGSYFNNTYMESSKSLFRELDDYKPLVADSTLAFEPGTDWQYSNTGMFLLGVVIEKVAGQNYFDYIRENIYNPAGMVNSDCYNMDQPVPNLAIGYSREQSKNETGWTNNIFKHVIRGGPAGGGFSTVEDLLLFDLALRSHKLLNPQYTELVWSSKPKWKSPDYGFGFGVRGKPGDRIVGHGGGFDGISSNLDMFLDSGYTAVVMSNYDGGAHPINEKIRELIASRK